MYEKMLIATDGTELGGKAVEHGLALAKSVGASVVVVTVSEMWSVLEMATRAQSGQTDAVKEYEKLAAGHASEILATAAKQADGASVACVTRHVSDSHPSDGILRAADDEGCDLIVMSTHGRRGLNRVLLGSVASEVVTHAKIPVLVVRNIK